MQLKQLSQTHDFGEFNSYELEDLTFYALLRNRINEDVDLMAYVLLKERTQETTISEELLIDALRLTGFEKDKFVNERDDGFGGSSLVRTLTRAPVVHDEKAILLLARFMNFLLAKALRDAAGLVKAELLTPATPLKTV